MRDTLPHLAHVAARRPTPPLVITNHEPQRSGGERGIRTRNFPNSLAQNTLNSKLFCRSDLLLPQRHSKSPRDTEYHPNSDSIFHRFFTSDHPGYRTSRKTRLSETAPPPVATSTSWLQWIPLEPILWVCTSFAHSLYGRGPVTGSAPVRVNDDPRDDEA